MLLALVRERTPGRLAGRVARSSTGPGGRPAGLGLLAKPGLGHGSIAADAGFRRDLGRRACWPCARRGDGSRLHFRALSRDRVVWLGRISYGLYMYHEIAFFLQRKLFDFAGWFPYQEVVAPARLGRP